MEASLDGAHFNAKQSGCLGVGETRQIEQHDSRPLPMRQVSHSLTDSGGKIGSLRKLLRTGLPIIRFKSLPSSMHRFP